MFPSAIKYVGVNLGCCSSFTLGGGSSSSSNVSPSASITSGFRSPGLNIGLGRAVTLNVSRSVNGSRVSKDPSSFEILDSLMFELPVAPICHASINAASVFVPSVNVSCDVVTAVITLCPDNKEDIGRKSAASVFR